MFRQYSKCFPFSSLHTLAIIVFVFNLVLPSSTGVYVYDKYKLCRSELFSCGSNVSNVGYPFWGSERPKFCGHPAFQLLCFYTETTMIFSTKHELTDYNVIKFSAVNFALELQWLGGLDCSSINLNFSGILKFTPNTVNVTLLYKCPGDIPLPHFNGSDTCYLNDTFYKVHYVSNMTVRKDYASCRSFEVPLLRNELDLYNKGEVRSIADVIDGGFEVSYEPSAECSRCQNSGGICGSSNDSDFVCLCEYGESEHVCQHPASTIARRSLIFLGSALLAVGIGVLLLVMCYRHRKRSSIRKFAVFWKSEAPKCANVDAF